jgi:DNA-binding response OmpR family regulator/Tfp pilus assembly protein PilZ
MDPRILVVDDDTLIRSIMRDTLTTLPATVLEAKNGEEGVSLAKSERPDLIFLDTMMPGMDGFQTAEALKQDGATAGIPLVFVSALGTSTHKVKGLDLGAEDYISKPIDPEELKARVRSILRRTRPAAPPPPQTAPSVAKGMLQTMALPTLIGWLELERRSARLLLSREEMEGEILFRDGQITHASQGARLGDAAVYEMLAWTEGTFNILPPESTPKAGSAVTLSSEELLTAGGRRREDVPGMRAALPGGDVVYEVPVALRSAVREGLPTAAAGILDLLDGTRTLDRILEGSALDAWATLKVMHRLLQAGALGWTSPSGATPPRRSVPRVPVQGSLKYRILQPAEEASRFTLSTRGIFVSVPTPPAVNDQVYLQLQFSDDPSRITAVGQVVWRKSTDEGASAEEAGMGLQFLEAAPEMLESVEREITRSIAAEVRKAMEEL